ncbi:sensor histidine kinase [Microbacterium sp. A93]|uniref:sensor histidine kinase n=1 Tax=unclassified Microbacterium TaxID=2609290 RepID=UPI003F44459D
MAFDRSATGDSRILRLARERLSALERIALLVIVVGIIVLDVFGLVFGPVLDLGGSVFSIASTAVFALYLWSPLIGTCSLGLVFALSFLVGSEGQVLAAAAVAAGLVLRLGWTALILSYTGAFLLATAITAYTDDRLPADVGIYLILATVAGAIGFALRMASARGQRLELQLAIQAEQEHEAVLAERRWIAGELHDSIAHHLTVVALHVQMLDDAEASKNSQEAIRQAAAKAMTDLRFVIELADDGPRSPGMQTEGLAVAINEARHEFESAGYSVVCEGDPRDERISRAGDLILARIMRESATNILKYAGGGEVRIGLDIDSESALLTICSPLPATPRQDLSSSRTGLNRMAERVLGASGEFSAGAVDDSWCVSARLPTCE